MSNAKKEDCFPYTWLQQKKYNSIHFNIRYMLHVFAYIKSKYKDRYETEIEKIWHSCTVAI